MTVRRSLSVLLAAAALAGPAVAETLPATTEDGLVRRHVPDVDIAYVREGADLSEYDRVLLGPVSVSFRRNFERDAATGPNRRISESDLDGIRERLAEVLLEELSRELSAGNYQVVTTRANDVMRLDLSVNDLYLAMPPQRQGPDEVMAFSTGEMLLEAEVSDSVSGEKLARIYDMAEGKVTHQLHRVSRSENAREAREIAVEWARTIRERLDAARRKGAAQ